MSSMVRNSFAFLLVAITAIPFIESKKSENLIEEIRFPKKNRLEVRINKEFKDAYLRDDFFVEYDSDIDLTKLDYTIVTLPFIMNVMSLIWISGKDYYIEALDQEVCDSLERVRMLFKLWYPNTTWDGRLIPRTMTTPSPFTTIKDDNGIALLFSGGIDSLTCSYKNREKSSCLLLPGQSCLPLDHPDLWLSVKNRIIDFAATYGHENAFLSSNYYYFLNLKKLSTLSPDIFLWRIQTVEDIGWAGLIAPILLSRGISTLHIGSSDSIHRFYPTACNPYIDGNIRFAGLQVKHDQFDLTRFDKLRYIVELCKSQLIKKPAFIICQKPGNIINCGSCEKCCITQLCLLALNEDPRNYGYHLPADDIVKQNKALLKKKKISSLATWTIEDLQKSGSACPKTGSVISHG